MKKNCNIIKDLLPLYVDEVCSEDSKKIVEEHLKDCDNCQKELESINFYLQTSKLNEKNIFKKFIKKINYKIIRNAILITLIIILISIPCLKFYGNHEFTMEYTKDMKIIFHNSGNRWNFQFDAPICGMDYGEVITTTENNEIINYIFLTRKYTLQDLNEKHSCGTTPNINYQNINKNKKMKVYYTTTDFDKIKNANDNELKTIINNSNLIFENETISKTMNCNLNNKDYNYTLTYYKVNEQIIESIGDDNLPNKILMDIHSIKGNYKSLWFTGDTATDTFNKLKEYIVNNRGTCSLN